MPQGLGGLLWTGEEEALHLQQVDRPSTHTWGAGGVQERGVSRCPRGPRRAPRQAWAERCARLAARGFRNRVAGVSALGRPHLCRPALDSPPCGAAARDPGVAEPPPAAAAAWTPGSRRISHPKKTEPCACPPKPLAGAFRGPGSETLTFTARVRVSRIPTAREPSSCVNPRCCSA